MKYRYLMLCLAALLAFSLTSGFTAAKNVSFSLSVNNDKPESGQAVLVTVSAEDLTDMYGYEINLTYDPNRLRYVKASSSLAGFPVDMPPKDGKIVFAHTKVGRVAGTDGKAELATITFEAIAGGKEPTAIALTKVKLVKSDLSLTNHEANIKLSISPVGGLHLVTFTDLNGHWAKESIERAAGLGFVVGYEDGTFKPQKNVTRAEFTAMIARAMKLEAKGDATLKFTDLDRIANWAKPFISEAQSAGVITGYQDGTFRPNNQITRTEMVVMIMRTLGVQLDSSLRSSFADTDRIPAWAQPSIAAAADASLITGRGNNQFVPEANTTRAEAITLILRLLDYKERTEVR